MTRTQANDESTNTQTTTDDNTMPETITIDRDDLIPAYQNNTKNPSQYQVRVNADGSTDIITDNAHEMQNEIERIPPRRFISDDTDPAHIDTGNDDAMDAWRKAIYLTGEITLAREYEVETKSEVVPETSTEHPIPNDLVESPSMHDALAEIEQYVSQHGLESLVIDEEWIVEGDETRGAYVSDAGMDVILSDVLGFDAEHNEELIFSVWQAHETHAVDELGMDHDQPVYHIVTSQ